MIPKLSVIVPAWNAEDTLGSCLSALLNQTLPQTQYEVIVVDDGSEDGTAELAIAAGVRLLQQERRGPAAARNAGVRIAQGTILVFTDADCVPAQDFLEQVNRAFEQEDLEGSRGVYRTNQRGLVPRFVQQEYSYKYSRMLNEDSIDFVDTYAAAYRRDTFIEHGGFDERFRKLQDQEFSFRLARLGYTLKFVPEAVVYHQHDRNLLAYHRRKFGIGHWKAALLRLHPDRVSGDTHTPLAQRLQVGLLPLSVVLAPLALLSPFFGGAALACIAFCILSAMPEFVFILRNDKALFWLAPVMILLRTFSLSVGLITGLLSSGKKNIRSSDPPLNLRQRILKRALDLLLAVVGLLLSLPIFCVVALAIKLDSPGPVFFIQQRVGEGGRRFQMIKFRSMVQGAGSRLDQVLSKNPLMGPAFKIPDDPRVTRVGRFLRRWSLDELPQLWNVLCGEMSMVGPRPEEVRVVEQYHTWHRRRLAVPPGLTGPMQVAGRGLLDLDERVRMEIDYIENYSIWKDLLLLIRTFAAVLHGKGAI